MDNTLNSELNDAIIKKCEQIGEILSENIKETSDEFQGIGLDWADLGDKWGIVIPEDENRKIAPLTVTKKFYGKDVEVTLTHIDDIAEHLILEYLEENKENPEVIADIRKLLENLHNYYDDKEVTVYSGLNTLCDQQLVKYVKQILTFLWE